MNKYACLDELAIYFKDEKSDFRTPFFRDIDKILYSLSFQRYMDKTQVFSFKDNDHLTKRMIHVLYVSKIARTIGRKLGLNEDLIEAIALGHDLGHTPFGHVGEEILNEISINVGMGYFNHNVHSVRLLMNIENYGKGKNITIQTLDGILCHNGEIAQDKYMPKAKSKEEFLNEYNSTYIDKDASLKLIPMTLEACVVRISDLIAYLGRDIDDAIRMNLLKWEDVPKSITSILGDSNSKIINTIIEDILKESKDKNYIKLSKEIFDAINKLKDFNYKNIYYKAYLKEEKEYLKRMLNTLYETYLDDLKNNNVNSNIIKSYLVNMSDFYKTQDYKKIVIDYIAGMTDDYALKEYNKILKIKHNNNEVL